MIVSYWHEEGSKFLFIICDLGPVYTKILWVGAQRNGVFWLELWVGTIAISQLKHSIFWGSNPNFLGVNRPLDIVWTNYEIL